MNDRYEKIRGALAMNPTPGPWLFCPTNSGVFVKSERVSGYLAEVRHCRTTQDVNADASFIAACDPDTIRELLAERDALAAEVERLREALRELEGREQRDEALLRQALDRLEAVVEHFDPYIRDNECRPVENARSTIAALRERLGEEVMKEQTVEEGGSK